MPCTPESISAEVDCDSNTLVVSYSESEGADLYTAIVQDSDGQTTSCHSTEVGSCSLSNIACGQIYRAVVVSSDGYCESPPTPVSQALPGRKAEHMYTDLQKIGVSSCNKGGKQNYLHCPR